MALGKRAQKVLSALAVASVFGASALPTAYALSRCRMTGEFELEPCCGQKHASPAAEHATARATPCCEKVVFQAERLPGATDPDSRPSGAVGPAVAALEAAPAPSAAALLRRWNRPARAGSAGPPLFIQTCSLLI